MEVKLYVVLSVVCLAVSAHGQRPADAPGNENEDIATHTETKQLDVPFKRLATLVIDGGKRLLAGDTATGEIKVIGLDGKLLDTWQPGVIPESIDVAADGTVYCGGKGKVAILDRDTGKATTVVDAPDNVGSDTDPRRRRGGNRGNMVAGIAVSDRDVFVTFGTGWSTGAKAKLFRFDRNLGNPVVLAEGLRGCCQRCDLVTKDGLVYVAENAVHRVVAYDRDGKIVRKWGSRSRTGVEGFGSCCNPMNLCFGPGGELYTAESGLARIKRYSVDGDFLGLVGYVGTTRFTRASNLAASCSNIALVTTANADQVFVMDFQEGVIRVMEPKRP